MTPQVDRGIHGSIPVMEHPHWVLTANISRTVLDTYTTYTKPHITVTSGVVVLVSFPTTTTKMA